MRRAQTTNVVCKHCMCIIRAPASIGVAQCECGKWIEVPTGEVVRDTNSPH